MATTRTKTTHDTKGAAFKMPDEENLRLRAQLMAEVKSYYEASGLTQKKAAQKLGIQQSRLNEVLKGQIDKCTIDRLVRMLAAVGRHVSIKIDAEAA